MSEQETPAKEATEDKRKTIYLNRLSLYAANNEAGQAPRLYWGIFDGNPRLIVRTNDPNDEKNNYGQIVAPIDGFTCSVISDMLITAASKEPGWREKIVNKSTWHNGQKLNEPTRINDIIVGKDNEGCVYISLHEDNRPNVRFFFGPSQWHQLVKSDGTPWSKQELSVIYSKAYGEILRTTVASILGYGSYVSTFTDFDGNNNQADKPTFSRGGGNWQNRNQGGGGGYQKGNWNNNRGGGGGGYQNRGGGNWQNRNQGGGSNNWQNRNQGGGGYQNRQQNTDNVADEDIPI